MFDSPQKIQSLCWIPRSLRFQSHPKRLGFWSNFLHFFPLKSATTVLITARLNSAVLAAMWICGGKKKTHGCPLPHRWPDRWCQKGDSQSNDLRITVVWQAGGNDGTRGEQADSSAELGKNWNMKYGLVIDGVPTRGDFIRPTQQR